MKSALVMGAGGFIGSHMCKRLKEEGYFVRGVDLKYPLLEEDDGRPYSDEFIIHDLREQDVMDEIIIDHDPRAGYYENKAWCKPRLFNEIYQFAADMGGAGYVFTGEHDSDIMSNSATINLNLINSIKNSGLTDTKIFYSSSACMYPEFNQVDTDNPNCKENSAYPAQPDSEYGWEKLFSERLYLALHRNYGIPVRIARFHNIFGPYGSWNDGKEKAPAAFCRKVAEAIQGQMIEMWGDGKQTRSFLYIDECIEGVRKLMNSDFIGPVNIGSDEMVSINELVNMIMKIAIKTLAIEHIDGPQGVRGRCSDNSLIQEKLGWKPTMKLIEGLKKTYKWINSLIQTT